MINEIKKYIYVFLSLDNYIKHDLKLKVNFLKK